MTVTPKILITRPEEEGKKLASVLESNHFAVVLLPTLMIVPVDNHEAILENFKHAHKLIFVSRNAVKQVAEVAPEELKTYPGTIFSIGSGTAEELYAKGVKEVIYPSTRFSSEGLLELPEFDSILDEHIVIFSGLEGRELLATTLVDKGAIVTQIAVYQRSLPNYRSQELSDLLDEMDCILVFSRDGLENLVQLIDSTGKRDLFGSVLLVASDPMLKLARDRGFYNEIIIPAFPTEKAVVEALCHHFKKPILMA